MNEAVDNYHRNTNPNLQEGCTKFSYSCRPWLNIIVVYESHLTYVESSPDEVHANHYTIDVKQNYVL